MSSFGKEGCVWSIGCPPRATHRSVHRAREQTLSAAIARHPEKYALDTMLDSDGNGGRPAEGRVERLQKIRNMVASITESRRRNAKANKDAMEAKARKRNERRRKGKLLSARWISPSSQCYFVISRIDSPLSHLVNSRTKPRQERHPWRKWKWGWRTRIDSSSGGSQNGAAFNAPFLFSPHVIQQERATVGPNIFEAVD